MSASQSLRLGVFPVADAAARKQTQDRTDGNKQLLARVWSEQAGPLAALAVGLGLDRDQAADVLQDVYVTALRRSPPVEADADLARWLVRVTINRCHQEHRRRGRWRRHWRWLATAWRADGHVRSPSGELRREVDAALAQLAEHDRLLVVLRYFVNLNSSEIAEIVDQPESTIRGRLRAARLKLAELLSDWKE